MRVRSSFKWVLAFAVLAYAASPAGAQSGAQQGAQTGAAGGASAGAGSTSPGAAAGGNVGASADSTGTVGFQRKTSLTPQEQVADLIEGWFSDGAADGFNIMPPVLPAMLDVFRAEVIPILQDRGLFHREYEGATLRENLGAAPRYGRDPRV